MRCAILSAPRKAPDCAQYSRLRRGCQKLDYVLPSRLCYNVCYMLIGIDASRAARPERTGTENYAYHLIRSLLAQNTAHQYRLYFSQPPPAGLFDSRAEARVIRVPRLWTHLGLGTEMLRRPPELLFVPAHVLPLAHPRHSVVTIHDLGHHYFPEAHTAAQCRYLEWSTRFAVRHSARLIAVSQATKDDLLKLYGAEARKVTVVHHGVDNESGSTSQPASRDTEQLAARLGLPRRYIIAIGTVQPRKNYARLIAAYASLGLARAELALVIVGKPGWNSAEIEAQAAQAGVILAGHVSDEEKAALLAGASAYALPSLYEGFGMPILEAQAAGVPVITSSTSSCPEVAGDGALLVDPLDTQAIAQALRSVLADVALRRGLIAKGIANAAKFSWERCARESLAVLEAAHGEGV
jgi:glycosyltransferase involved in cell wall biosynthesis